MRTSGRQRNGVQRNARSGMPPATVEIAAHENPVRDRLAGAPHTDSAPPTPVSRGRRDLRSFVGSFWGQATLCMVVATIIRVAFLLRSQGMFDGDEAAVGYQAEQVLHGVLPTYIMNDNYLGSLSVYLITPVLLLVGPSSWALRIPSLLKSLALIPLTGTLAERLYGRRARLPALVLSTLPALYVAVGELRALGGYIETFVFGTTALLLVVLLFERLERGQAIMWLLVGLGFLCGLAYWTFPLFLAYAGAAVLWALPLAVIRLRRAAREGALPWRQMWLGVVGGLGGVLAGYSPAVLYGLRHHFVNFQWLVALLRGGNPAYAAAAQAPDPLRVGELYFLLTRALPRLTGSYPLWSSAPSPSILQHIGLAFFAAAVVYTLVRVAQRIPLPGRGAAVPASFEQTWKLVLAPLLLLVVSVMYWRSSFSDGYVVNYDRTGRYMLPAGTAITLLLAYWFADLPALCSRLIQAARARLHRSSPPASANHVSRAGGGVALALFAVLLAFYLTQYVSANAVLAMQTPYRPRDLYPVVDAQMLTYLEQHHITDVWTIHWLGYVLMYQSNSHIVAADMRYHDVFPQNVQTVEAASRPTYIIEADPAKGECAVAKALDAMHVTYTAVPFQHWWVITPLSRNVSPTEIQEAIAPDYDR